MYICPTCAREFSDKDMLVKHFLACWKERHPGHKPKDAPRSPNIETRQVNDEAAAFFAKGVQND